MALTRESGRAAAPGDPFGTSCEPAGCSEFVWGVAVYAVVEAHPNKACHIKRLHTLSAPDRLRICRSASVTPPIVQRCRVLSRPHASYSCRARVPRDVGQAMVLHEHDGDEQVGTYIIDIGDCMDTQLD